MFDTSVISHRKTNKDTFLNIRYEILVCLFFVVSVLAVYCQVRNHEFLNYDDPGYVTENLRVKSGLSLKNIYWAFTTTTAGNWHPITMLSHMLDCQLYRLSSGNHHITSVLIHILNTLLLFLLLNKITGQLWKSAFVVALFALHPLRVESVAWVSERKDVLFAFFWMLTLWSYVWYVKCRNLKRYFAVLIFFILSLMSKPMAVTLPFALLLLDYWPLNRFHQSNLNRPSISQSRHYSFSSILYLIYEKIPLFFISALFSGIIFFVQKGAGAVVSLDTNPFDVRIANALVSYVSYIGKTIWPHQLAVFYPHPGIIPNWQTTAASVLIAAVTLIALSTIRRCPYIIIGWLWYMGILVPVSGVAQAGSHALADRFTYIPSIGLYIILVWGVSDFMERVQFKKKKFALLGTLLLTILMTTTYIQVGHWSNSIALFQHAIKVTENNDLAHFNLGNAYMSKGKINKAIDQYHKAIHIKPDAQTYTNLGIALFNHGNIDEAITKYKKALRISPNLYEAHNSMGNALYAQGKFKKAMDSYAEALRIKPNYFQAHNNLGLALYARGNVDKAIFHYTETLRIKPDYAETYNNLGAALIKKGMVDKAVVFFKEAVRIDPGNAVARNNLKECLGKQGNE